ncbi:hypothetical protein VH22019_00028 [Vibrio phage VH2_2019]|nr:hypothetical protein VH22019_00028 [Vibrio phage VH2_2019]
MYYSLDTLKTNPLFTMEPLDLIKVSDIIPAVIRNKQTYADHGLYYPEIEALKFYLLNHLVAERTSQLDRHEPLNELDTLLVQDYIKEVGKTATAMFTYLLLICTREVRHTKETSSTFQETFKEKHPNTQKVFKMVQGTGSSGAVSTFLNHGCEGDIVSYCAGLVYAFYQGSFSSGFGGHAWGGIADVLYAFVNGTISAEMMIDQSFHLAHNNGAIFNKGMVFNMYSGSLATILDVQRSGQIPNLIQHGFSKSKNKILDVNHRKASEALLEKYKGDAEYPEVDWEKVMSLGGKGSYHHLVPDKPKEPEKKKVVVYGNTALEIMELQR